MTEEARIKDRARAYANSYKGRGLIVQEPCRICGSEQSQMHHEDYSKPLKVLWLCRPCHLHLHTCERGFARSEFSRACWRIAERIRNGE